MTCERFERSFVPETNDAEVLEHLRACDHCLDFAAGVDPDVMFRALGGSEMIPPGGVDAFVEEVMQQVRLREVESVATPRRVVSWPRRLAVAATIAAGVTGALLVQRLDTNPTPAARVAAPIAASHPVNLTTKPIVETYESENATIVEVPIDSTDDVKMVMIFDENLPADL